LGKYQDFEYLCTQQDGVYLFAERSTSQSQLDPLTKYNPPRCLVKLPAVVGAQWHRPVDGKPEVDVSDLYTIAGFETVTTPAGEFKGCLKVRHLFSTHRTADTVDDPYRSGSSEMESVVWYAPDVGMVKQVDTDRMTVQERDDKSRNIASTTELLLESYKVKR